MNSVLIADALRVADAMVATVATDATVMSCPGAAAVTGMTVTVVGEDNVPLAGIAVALANDEGKVVGGVTLRDGTWTLNGLAAGTYRLSLPELDGEAWEAIGTAALPLLPAAPTPAWQAPGEVARHAPFQHRVAPGECLARIAYRAGFFPATIWDCPENAVLKALRVEPNILAPGDVVHVPARRQRVLAITAGTAVRLRRRGVPERLRLRFLDMDNRPRAQVPFVLFIDLADGTACPVREGRTDAGGFVNAVVPPDAGMGLLVLDPGGANEEYDLELAYLDPLDTAAGVQARLNNLGYSCGDEDGIAGPRTRSAIAAFQGHVGLAQTGELDANTRERLVALALS